MAAVEALLDREHVHRAALAVRIAVRAAGEFRHHPLRVHVAGEHVAVIAIAGDHRVAGLEGHLHADDDRFLPDVEVAEAADQAHAVHLAGLLLETPDQQHLAVGGQLLFLGEFGDGGHVVVLGGGQCFRLRLARFGLGDGHTAPRDTTGSSPHSGNRGRAEARARQRAAASKVLHDIRIFAADGCRRRDAAATS